MTVEAKAKIDEAIDRHAETARIQDKIREKVEQIPGVKAQLDAEAFWDGKNTATLKLGDKLLTIANNPISDTRPSRTVSLSWGFNQDLWATHLGEGRDSGRNMEFAEWFIYLDGPINSGNRKDTLELIDAKLDSIPDFFTPKISITVTKKQ